MKALCYVAVDDNSLILSASSEKRTGMHSCYVDVTGWNLFSDSVPLYCLVKGLPIRRSDAEIDRDKRRVKH